MERWELNGYFLFVSLLHLQAYLLGSDVKPLLSQGLEEISVSVGCDIRKLGKGVTKICISFAPLPISVGTQWLLFFGPDVGPLWSQGLEGSSVSIGCEIRKLWKG